MNLTDVAPELLTPNPWNTNKVSPESRVKLSASLERHGWVKPVIARETPLGLQILGGQHRVEAAVELGYDTVPVINLGEVDDNRAKEIGLIDNARYGQDDAIGLAELLADLGGAPLMAEFLPIGVEELAMLGTDIDDDEIENLLSDDNEAPNEPESKPTKTHQIMRFKVALQDADVVEDFFEKVMNWQDFTEADSLTNAGDALVYVARHFEEKPND